MKSSSMEINDLEFKSIKDLVRERIKGSDISLASDIYVYPEYPIGWSAVFGVMDPVMTQHACVMVIHCAWGVLDYSYHKMHGFLPSGALIVKDEYLEGEAMSDEHLRSLIQERLAKKEADRKQLLENSGWMVQFIPCGHSAELDPKNPLVEKAKNRTHLDALVLPLHQCPICNPDVDIALYAHVYE